MTQRLGTIIFETERLILKYDEGFKQIFEKDNNDYSVGAQWIDWQGERYFLKRD